MSYIPSDCGCTHSLLISMQSIAWQSEGTVWQFRATLWNLASFARLETNTTHVWSAEQLISSNRARLIWVAVPFRPVFPFLSVHFYYELQLLPQVTTRERASHFLPVYVRQGRFLPGFVSHLLKFKEKKSPPNIKKKPKPTGFNLTLSFRAGLIRGIL